MKRLYCVSHIGSNKPMALEGAGESPYFDNKEKAKELRDWLNEDSQTKYHISLGPDHDRFGVKNNPRTHSHKATDPVGDGFPHTKKGSRKWN